MCVFAAATNKVQLHSTVHSSRFCPTRPARHISFTRTQSHKLRGRPAHAQICCPPVYIVVRARLDAVLENKSFSPCAHGAEQFFPPNYNWHDWLVFQLVLVAASPVPSGNSPIFCEIRWRLEKYTEYRRKR